MKRRFSWVYLSLVFLAATALTGCGSDGPQLASVTGVITIDGQPLPDATVEFQPSPGSPSIGVTDSSGRYKLKFTAKKAGAMLGKHQVRITLEKTDAEGKRVGPVLAIPAKYNRSSELTAEVKAGSNQVDFALTSR